MFKAICANRSNLLNCFFPANRFVRIGSQKNLRAHKNKISTFTLPSKKKPTGRGGLPAERTTKCQAPIKLAQPFPAPELQTEILWTSCFCFLRFARITKIRVANLPDSRRESPGHLSSRTLPWRSSLQFPSKRVEMQYHRRRFKRKPLNHYRNT